MSADLESRLNRAAEAWREQDAAPPALEPMLDAALARRRRGPVLAVAASVAAAAAVVGVVVAISHRPSSEPVAPQAVASTAPATITVDGKTLQLVGSEAWSTPILDETDRRVVWIFAPVDGGPSCTVTPVPRITAASARSVTVVVDTYAAPMPSPMPSTVACPSIAHGPARLKVTLTRPLGSRVLIDGSNGAEHQVLDPHTVPKPSYLPDGYSGGTVQFGQPPSGPRVDAAYREYQGPHSNSFAVAYGPSSLNRTGPQVIRRTTVDGHPATVSNTPGFEQDILITWAVDATHAIAVYQMSSYEPGSTALSVDELLRVARSVR